MLSPVADNLKKNRHDGESRGAATAVVLHSMQSNATSHATEADPVEALPAEPS
jgi:hypothetical protein